jgi:hypothetical protein
MEVVDLKDCHLNNIFPTPTNKGNNIDKTEKSNITRKTERNQ